MKDSLFKKNEITKKQAGEIFGGETTHDRPTIGMKTTARYVIPWGVVSDSEASGDWSDWGQTPE